MKSDITKTRLRRRAVVAAARRSIAARSVVAPGPADAGVRISSCVIRRIWSRPARGGITWWASVVVEDRADPVAALRDQPAQADRQFGRHRLLALARPDSRPKRIEADRSTTSQAVSSRSSVYCRTNGSSRRAVTFQSMCRTSSSGV